MKKTTFTLLLLLAALNTYFGQGLIHAASGQKSSYKANQLMIRFAPGTPQQNIDDLKSQFNAVELEASPLLDIRLWEFQLPLDFEEEDGTITTLNAIIDVSTRLNNSVDIDGTGLNYIVQHTPMTFSQITNLLGSPQYNPIPECSNYPGSLYGDGSTAGDIKIGIVDTGVDFASYPELFADLLVTGFNVIDGTKNILDDNGHGTSVSGIIAGMLKSAPSDINGQLYIFKALDLNGRGELFNAIEGIELGIQTNMNIINLSWGFVPIDKDASAQLLEEVIQFASLNGTIVVTAAGNQDQNLGEFRHYPAAFSSPQYLLTVASTDCNGNKSSFTNFSPDIVDVAAPGEKVLCPTLGGIWRLQEGTSFSSAILVGALVQAGAKLTSWDPELLRCRILNAVYPMPGYQDFIIADGPVDLSAQPPGPLDGCNGGGIGVGGRPIRPRLSHNTPNQNVEITNAGFTLPEESFVKQEGEDIQIDLFPNPFRDQINLSLNATTEGKVLVQIYNAAGQQIQQSFITHEKGVNTWSSNIEERFGSGLFFVKVIHGTKVQSFKLLRR